MLVRRATTRECERLFRKNMERRGERLERYRKRLAPFHAAFSFVSAQGTNSTSSSSLTTPSWVASTGDMVVVAIAMFGQTLNVVSDVNGKVFTKTAVRATAGSGNLYVAYGFNVTGSAVYTVTATTTGGPNEFSIAAAGFTPPAATTVSLDTSLSAAAQTVSLLSVIAGDLIIGGASQDQTAVMAAGAGYTIPTNGLQPANGDAGTHQPVGLEYNLNGAGGTTVVNFTLGGGTGAIWGLAFKAVSSGLLTGIDYTPGVTRAVENDYLVGDL